ncbi:RluA family pseudouridine synthase [Ruoffia tabacinasalis]|uniref:RluA family pseudouridine synthase n=1 Tax=Ruoffia tabacinasalis TaxID=87458 RepID=UPI003F96C7D6
MTKIKETKKFELQGEVGRLDKVLVDLLSEETYSRSTIQKLLKNQHITVDGVHQKANYKLNGSEVINVEIPEEEQMDILPEDIPLDIVYEDDDVLVINKPIDMVVHPSKGHPSGTLVNALVYYLDDNLSNNEDTVRPGIVHRIDRDTSGLIVVAKNNHAHQKLSEQLEDHSMGRTYVALVNEVIETPTGIIEAPINRDPSNRIKYTTNHAGRYALTHFEVLETFAHNTLVKVELKTGRTHQIRVHLEFIGHPIVGDPLYRQGVGQMKGQLARLDDGQFLHAQSLHFVHPTSGEAMNFETDLPERFEEVLRTLR